MTANNIGIYYLSVGSGHKIAAESLNDAFKQMYPKKNILLDDPFADRLEIFPSILNAFQSASVTIAPEIYDFAWRRGVLLDTYEWATDIDILQEFLIKKLEENKIETVIATHVLPCALAVGIKKRWKIIKKVYGVITDFGVHKFWPLEGVDGYFVGHEEIKNTLIFRGVTSEIIRVTGIPIKPTFDLISQQNNKINDKMNVLFAVGGVRSSAYAGSKHFLFDFLRLYEKEAFENVQLTIITGHQKKLKTEIQEFLDKHTVINVQVIGFTQRMDVVLSRHHILITKPGGLMIAEALAAGIGVILYKHGSGQENANVEFLARHNLAFNGEEPSDIINILKSCSKNPKIINEIQNHAKKFGYPNAAQKIASIISKKLNDQI